MALTPEKIENESEIDFRPEQMEIPPHIESGGVSATQKTFTQTVSDDSGKVLVQSPQVKAVSIQLPSDVDTLKVWAKGSPLQSITWFARFWLRLLKKAILYGWQVIVKEK
jgi:hypothetical protein